MSWAEVFCGSGDEGRWVHVDPLLNWLDKPEQVEGGGVRQCGLAYVVAFANGGAKDVTRRYIGHMPYTQKLRDSKWFKHLLAPLHKAEGEARVAHMQQQDGGTAASGKPQAEALHSKASIAMAAREDEELRQIQKEHDQVKPSSVDDFRNHPLYILERHLGRYDAVRPGAANQGLHRGEKYFLRDDLVHLHTKERWLQEGRVICEDQVKTPFKQVKKRGAEAPAQDQEADPDAVDVNEEPADQPAKAVNTSLYGEWQTEVWVAPEAKDGVVPKNERGNVMCPPLVPSLPKGTRDVNVRYVTNVCRKMGIDYAPALRGFSYRGGRATPIIEGVVVCEEFADEVQRSAEQAEE
eukprot:jgi/Astpho2/7608/Aster-x0327